MKKNLIIISIMLASCSPVKNSAISPIHGKENAEGRMQIMVESTQQGNAKGTAVTSDGEVFNGNIVAAKSYSHGIITGATTEYYKDKKGRVRSRSNDASYSEHGYTSDARGVFIGSKGHSMDCEFTLSNAVMGIAGGGVGECEISDGRKVPVNLPEVNRNLF